MFKTTFGPIAWSAALNAPADATEIDLVLSRRSPAGVETTLHAQVISVPDPQVDVIAGYTDLAAFAGGQEGTYLLRLLRDNHVIAVGLSLVR